MNMRSELFKQRETSFLKVEEFMKSISESIQLRTSGKLTKKNKRFFKADSHLLYFKIMTIYEINYSQPFNFV